MIEDAAAGDAVAGDAVAGDAVSAGSTPEERRALFRVVRGEPSDTELAALTVVLAAAAAAGAAGEDTAARPRDRWSDPAATLRTPSAVGPGAWRTTYWPR